MFEDIIINVKQSIYSVDSEPMQTHLKKIKQSGKLSSEPNEKENK